METLAAQFCRVKPSITDTYYSAFKGTTEVLQFNRSGLQSLLCYQQQPLNWMFSPSTEKCWLKYIDIHTHAHTLTLTLTQLIFFQV